eukprot:5298812-Pyramimonas_sp.AAC.1
MAQNLGRSDEIVSVMRQRVAFAMTQASAGLDRERLLDSQGHAMQLGFGKFQNLSFDEATPVSLEISSGPWSPRQKELLAAALNDVVNSPEAVQQKETRCQQFAPSAE